MSQGHFLKIFRIAKNINQNTVAGKLGISQQAYSKIEKSEYIEPLTLKKVLGVMSSNLQEFETLKKVLPLPAKIRDK